MTNPATPLDVPWHEFIGQLDWLLIDPAYLPSWAALHGIRDTVLATRRVSEAQRLVVERIRTSGSN
jgi:hypothetical protein